MRTLYSAACCGIAVVLASASPARAQDLLIQPRAISDATTSSVEFVFGESPEAGFPEATLELAAYLQMPDGSFADVSDAVTWQLFPTDLAHLEGYDLVFSEFGSVEVSAQFGSLLASVPCHYLERMSELGPEGASAITSSDEGPPVPRQDLSEAAGHLVNRLTDKGIPTDSLNDAKGNVTITDDRDAFKNPIGQSRRITNSKTGGMFIPKGLSFIGNGMTWFVYTDRDVIVLRPDVAEELVQQGQGAVHDHGLSNEAQVLLEEMIHEVIEEAGLQGQIGEAAEEGIVNEMVATIVPAMIKIATILAKPELSQLDLVRLHNNIRTMQDAFDTLRQDHGDLAVDLFLQALGWQDADGNGIPDFIDDMLEDLGIDPNDLPSSEPGGGGENPEPVDEPVESTGNPTVRPTDPHQPLPQ